jgi:hypothetical protein
LDLPPFLVASDGEQLKGKGINHPVVPFFSGSSREAVVST